MTNTRVSSSEDDLGPQSSKKEIENNAAISNWRPKTVKPPLEAYSLINSMNELEAIAEKQKPLLGQICLATQTTVLYAKPNTGKTLLALALLREAVAAGRIKGSACFYVAADDNPAGVIEKQSLLREFGIHVLVPGLNDFTCSKLRAEIEHMIETGSAYGTLLILDTLKKFTDLMDKKSSSSFADLARRYVMAGGTLIGLAHTNKRVERDGTAIFAGTSDIVDDFDCAHIIEEVPQHTRQDERVVQFKCIKRRGKVQDGVAYRYNTSSDLSYSQLLASVRPVEEADLSTAKAARQREEDAEAIDAIRDCIASGLKSKQHIVKEAALATRIGQHTIRAIIDRYCGPREAGGLWTYATLDRGRQEFWVHGPAPGEGDPNAVY